MKKNFGIMQGRLLPKYKGRYQAHPFGYWEKEFPIAAELGLDSIEFMNTLTSFEEHMNLYKKVDIALDTFPYNGVTTSFESIWMGAPVITMKGYNFNSRCGESINKNLNMEYLIAENEMDYVAKAKELSENNDKLLDIRKKIFDQAALSPLFDSVSFSNNFFKSLQTIYNK